MIDVKRTNEITRFVMNDRRSECKTDEERTLYDGIKWEYEENKSDGMTFDLIHDSEG